MIYTTAYLILLLQELIRIDTEIRRISKMANGNGISKIIKNPVVAIEIFVLIIIVTLAFADVKTLAANTDKSVVTLQIESKAYSKDIDEIKLNLKTFMESFDVKYQELN